MAFPPKFFNRTESVSERNSFDTGREKRRLTLIVCDGSRLALRTKLIERNALSREECQEILGSECLYPVCKFALPSASVPNAKPPRHVNSRSAVLSENVGR